MEATEMTDRLMALALAEGRREVFEMLFREWYTPLCRFACTLLSDRDDAEEAVQQVFVTLWEKREDLAIENSIRAYLYRAVRNTCLNHLKHLRVRRNHAAYTQATGSLESDGIPAEMAYSQLEVRLASALDRLPAQCRLVFERSRFGGLKYAEIAAELSISVKTVENHMGKALRLLREELLAYAPLLWWWLNDQP